MGPNPNNTPFQAAAAAGAGELPSFAQINSQINQNIPVAQFLGWNSAGTQIWARLKMAGLDVKCVYSSDLNRVILKIRCPKWRLEQMAEQMHMKVKTKDGYLKPFRVSRRDSFIPFGAEGNIFRSSERQQIIDFILRSKIRDGGAELDEHTRLGKFIVQRFPLHMYARLNDIRHSWVTFWKREKPGQISESWSPFSVSYKTTIINVLESVTHFCTNILNQPLDNIAEYFGENIAFYFAFMAFYTRWLVFPSILGVILFIIQIQSGQFDHWLCAPYAIILMVWICFLLVFWRQKASALAFRWGVLDYEVEETERPQFQGKEKNPSREIAPHPSEKGRSQSEMHHQDEM
jgi:anoctamin-8